MAKSSFKQVHDLEKRKAEAGRIQEKYTDRVPIDSIRGARCRTLEEQYEEYLVEFNKAYSQEEKMLRMEYFKKSLQQINEWNQRPRTAILGLTEFSDWSPEEWSGLTTVPNNLLPEEFYSIAETDHAIQDFTSSLESKSSVIDWVREGVVSPPSVRKQEGPFCWCHAAVSCIEAQVQKQSNEDNGIVEKRKLSVQQLMDCVQLGTSTACFTHAVQEGILGADAYPYVGPPPRPCYCKSILKPRTFLTQVEKPLMHVDKRAIKNKLKAGPLYAVVGCDPQLNAYKGGVLEDCVCDASCANHAMTLVGASREHGRKYWLFKNSWGREWGEQGFLKLVRGVKACRIGQFLHHPGKMRDTVNRISSSKRGNKGVRAEATIDSANVGCCRLFSSIC